WNRWIKFAGEWPLARPSIPSCPLSCIVPQWPLPRLAIFLVVHLVRFAMPTTATTPPKASAPSRRPLPLHHHVPNHRTRTDRAIRLLLVRGPRAPHRLDRWNEAMAALELPKESSNSRSRSSHSNED